MTAKKFVLLIAITIINHYVFAQPSVTSFSPTSGSAGTTVTITGTNFNLVAANDIVYFGAVKATVNTATTTSLTVTVPVGAVQQLISVTTNNLTAYSSQPFIVTFAGGGSLASKSFEYGGTITTSFYPHGISSGDFDGDGKPDVATVNNANVPSSYVTVHPNTGSNGSISFAPPVVLNIGDFGFGITSADFDGDGKLDIAATFLNANGNVSIYKNISSNGNIDFNSPITYAAGSSPYTIAATDIDRDGKTDIVICNYSGNTVSVLRNTTSGGNISFAPRVTFITDLAPYDLATGDLDGDGKPDIVTSNELSDNISAFRNTSTPGSISFASRVDYSSGSGPSGIAVGDVDGDNKPDVAIVNSADFSVSVLRNISSVGSFSFAPRINFPVPNTGPPGPKAVVISDMDADTKPELIVTGDNVYLFKNNCSVGSIAFGSQLSYFSSTPFRIAIADLDIDGKPDMAVTNVSYQHFSVYRNKVPAPQVSSFTPTTAGSGVAVTINGYNFTGSSAVSFGDVPATSYTVNNANSISAVVSSGAAGQVKVTTSYGTDSLSGFIFAGPPVISSFTSTSATTGDVVTITGQNFTGASSVSFGGTPALSFTIVSANTITAIVAGGASGAVAVTTPYGTGSLPGFTYLPVPIVSSFTPATGITGGTVTITGANFTGITAVNFGGIAASSFTVVSPTTITAIVANGASGNVTVTNSFGTGTLAGFNYIPPPVISSFTPTTAGIGTVITITGNNFTGATEVKFGGRDAANFTIVSPTTITAIVSGGNSGDVSVTAVGGTGSLPGFTYVPPPSITSFTPKITGTGGIITITGTNFTTTTSVKLGGTAASSFTVVNSTTITAVVGSGATGDVSISTGGGNVSLSGFSFITSPIINSFAPASGPSGTVVKITGANFNTNPASNIVYFGGVTANVTSASSNSINVVVPVGANYQPISITANNQTAYSTIPFLVTFPGGGSFNSNSFAGRTDFTTAGNPESIATGDLDGDGKPDVVIANTYSNTISFFRNTSTSNNLSFAPKIDSSVGLYPHAVKIADVDADGKLDVLLLNYNPIGGGPATENTITIFRNISSAGNLLFSPKFILVTEYHPQDLAVVDLNLDGKPDLATTHSGTSRSGQEYISVFTNMSAAGNLSFGQAQFITVAGSGSGSFFPNLIKVADIDNNDRPDLVVSFGNGDFISVMTNNSGIGSPLMGFQRQCFGGCWFGGGYLNVSTADFDGDGKIDAITDNRTLRNLNNGNSIDFDIQAANGIGGIVSVDGLSGTDKPDFVRANSATHTVSAVKNSSSPGSLSFESNVNYETGDNPRGVATADFNGDGKVDIAVTNKDFNTFSILLNNIGNTGPSINSFSPASGGAGTVVTITGSNFTGVTGVNFGGVAAASYNVVNSGTITAVVNSGTSGNVSVTTTSGTASLGWFNYSPSITSFSPAAAGTGLTVTITGTNFTGATAVSFGGVAASSFTVLSPTTIMAVIAGGATGTVSVTTPAGTVTANGFTYLAAPVVTSFTPMTGGAGTVVTITGNNFTGATQLRFGNASAASFTVVSPTTITAIVGNGSTGNVFITTPGGTAYSINQFFTFILPPTITSFTPNNGVSGSIITISGTNFTGTTSVSFGGVAATSFTVVNSTTITAVVGSGASGDVTVATPSDTASVAGFSFSIPTGIPAVNNNLTGLAVYPNPSTTSVWVDHPASMKAKIQVIDMFGRLLKEFIVERNSKRSSLDVQALSSGVYKIIWTDGKTILAGLVFKQ